VIAIENAWLLNELRARTEEIAGWNRELEARVAAQLAEIERTGKLRRFLAPQLADLIVAQGDESILESHRREIVVVFCDLRGFTGFAERAEPEEVMALLGDYHAAMGPIVASFEGTLDHYAGDGIMVFFNDPVPMPDPARRAIDMAVAMRAFPSRSSCKRRGRGTPRWGPRFAPATDPVLSATAVTAAETRRSTSCLSTAKSGGEPTFAEAAASDEVAPIADLARAGARGDPPARRWRNRARLEAAPAPARLIAARRRDPGGAPPQSTEKNR
jgi:class 3 adenylate cyclase